jgi:hypothetical protein
MEDFVFNVTGNQTIAREKMIAYLNTGTAESPVWSPMGRRSPSSDVEYDWQEETTTDILGNKYTSMEKPTMTQTFDPWDLAGGDAAQAKIVNLGIVQQDSQALTSQDMLIAHFYLNSGDEVVAHFAERYDACMVKPTSLGGDGGGNLGMSTDVTYGGTRTVGTVTKTAEGVVTFTPATAA